jgi:hypothetical protein
METTQKLNVTPEERTLIETFMGGKFWFRSDWNGLMKVVEKIKLIHPETENVFRHHKFWELTIFAGIDEVYQGVLNYLHWYNQQVKP